jgi:multicomponent Na+:H+ antiporter subunit E
MIRYLTFFFMILSVWILWSGHFELIPVFFGFCSSLLVLFLTRRMKLLDEESWPTPIMNKLPRYWLWLFWEITKSNLDVARRILSPHLPIEPRIFEIDVPLQTDLGRVIYANSITLTPGTVTTKLSPESIEIHALSNQSEADLRNGRMVERVRTLEKSPT